MNEEFKTTCRDYGDRKGCGTTITMKKEDGKWHPYNPDGSSHIHTTTTTADAAQQTIRATPLDIYFTKALAVQERLFPNTGNKDAAVMALMKMLIWLDGFGGGGSSS